MAPAGYIILDASGIILDVNQTMLDMLDKCRDDLMRKPFSRFIAPEDQNIFLARFSPFYKKPADKIMEIRLIKGSSSIFHARLEGRFIPLETVPGKPDIDQFCLIVTDITKTKKAENELREQKKRLEGIIEGTNVGTWEWNVQTGKTVFNDKWAQIIGYDLDELEPVTIKTWEACAHPEDFKKSGELLKRHFAGELPYYDFECRMKHKDGHWVEVHDRGKVITCITWTSDGNPLMMFGTHQDITQRKQAEQREKQTKRYLETILQTTVDGFWEIDRNGCIVEVNQAYCALSGSDRAKSHRKGTGESHY